MSGAGQTRRPCASWNSSNSPSSACARRRLGVTTVAPAARRAKSSALEIIAIGSLARLERGGAGYMMLMRVALLLFLLMATKAEAQDYPSREIRSICNFAPGSGADIVVRYYSDALAKLAGRPVVVDNKPGAQGLLASDFVAKSRPDGYTLMITPASSTLASAPHLFRKLPFDPVKDFDSVTTLLTLSFTIAVD